MALSEEGSGEKLAEVAETDEGNLKLGLRLQLGLEVGAGERTKGT